CPISPRAPRWRSKTPRCSAHASLAHPTTRQAPCMPMSGCAWAAPRGHSAPPAATERCTTWAAPQGSCARLPFSPSAAAGCSSTTTGSTDGSRRDDMDAAVRHGTRASSDAAASGGRHSLRSVRSRGANGGSLTPLALAAAQHVDELADLAPLLAFVAACDRVLDAVGDMIFEDLLLGPPQRRAHR